MYTFARILLPVVLLFVTLPPVATGESTGHRSFGIFYPESQAKLISRNEIEQLTQAGITWLMVEEALSEEQRRIVSEAGLSLFVMVPEYFPIPGRLSVNSRGYAERSDDLMWHFRNDSYVKGFGLFAFGSWQNRRTKDHLRQLSEPYTEGRQRFTLDIRPLNGEKLSPFDGIVLLTRSAAQLETKLSHNSSLSGILYAPDYHKMDLRDVQKMLSLLENHREIPIFFYRDWFWDNAFKNGDDLRETNLAHVTAFYYRIQDARIANPQPESDRTETDITILLLFVFWGLFAGYYRLNPMYRKSVSRFFLNYSFFVNDVLMRRIRFRDESVILFVIFSVASGLMAFSISMNCLDSISREALLTYIPLIPVGWSNPAVFFGIFFVITSLINGITITWLRITNHQHAHTYQIATLVLWPQHLNIAVVTVGIIVTRSFTSSLFAILMILTLFIITAGSFFITAYNMRRIHPTSPAYMASTYVLYVLVVTSVTGWLIYGTNLTSAWRLASSLAFF